ncbi:MAG: universal stress protein [Desulfobacterales bacterium]|nr:MAG: universal stress protein [Desulfobacterales bacterium]
MFKKILVALKFGSASLFALRKGIELAQTHGAELFIFHALDYALKELDQNDARLLELKTKMQHRFETEVKPQLSHLTKVTFECVPADPALAVCKLARKTETDLIIMGCHQFPEKMCLGRIDYVGMTILEKAPCPVLLVPLCE